jgi:segregation and condensation protein B
MTDEKTTTTDETEVTPDAPQPADETPKAEEAESPEPTVDEAAPEAEAQPEPEKEEAKDAPPKEEPKETDKGAGEEPEKVTLGNSAKPIVEALLFAADQPMAASKLSQVMGKRIDGTRVRAIIKELNEEYVEQKRAFEIAEIAGGFQIMTRPEYRKWVAELHKHRRQDKLTPSAIETLAIIAYRQPILRAKIDDIRGVQSGPMLRNLVERGLVKVVGVQNVPGHPKLYGTTRMFLDHFGLKSLKHLPKVDELKPGSQKKYVFK